MKYINEIENKYSESILKIISNHLGYKNPIRVKQIMQNIPLEDREIRKVVQYLINECKHPIGSTTRGPYGFYMIVNFEDFIEAVKNLSNRKDSLQERVDNLHEACKRNGLEFPRIDTNDHIVQNITNSVVIYMK